MRHVREHFSTELMLEGDDIMTKAISREAQQYAHGVAAIASNHSAATATAIYAGVFERHRYNSVQVIDCAMSSF